MGRHVKRWGMVALLAVAGCNLDQPNFRRPGRIYDQQLRATYHDPYGAVEGAPEIVGARPPSYERPRAQPVQSQWFN